MRQWHTLEIDDVLRALATSPQGLSTSEVAARQARFGPNALPRQAPRPWWRRLAAQFHDVLIYVLLAAAALSAMSGHTVDAVVIAAVVAINALVGLLQEGKAEHAMEAIGRMLALQARTRRDGTPVRVPARSLVPGDIVMLESGDRVPADLRLIEAHGLRIDQAVLTGESMPVGRQVDALPAETELAERRNMAWSGTMVVGGQAVGVVTATGGDSELGRIGHLLETIEPLSTPLIRQMRRFGTRLTLLLLIGTTAVIGLGIALHDLSPGEGFLAGVALIVSAIPEGLPAIMTVTLAIGVQRMARRQAIVRRLPAVETLGSVTVICSDKTGTLTSNELQAKTLVTAEGPFGPDALAAAGSDGRTLVETALLCNDAEPGSDHNDPIEAALLRLAQPAGVDLHDLRRARPRTAVLPFSSERRLMATAHGHEVAVKGAPESVLARCCKARTPELPDGFDPAPWQDILDHLAKDGLRMLAFARASADHEVDRLDEAVLDGLDLQWLGLIAFADPPRPEVSAAVATCRDAGISVKMMTGDHAATAGAIAEALGIPGAREPVTGLAIDKLDEDALAHLVGEANVFARTAPEHKLRLVQALQANGEVVAMTGDGANDAPALKRADIGVAMGIKGTEASRQAAAIVLADDNFASIAAGVEEGRGVYANLRKSLLFILPTNAAEYLLVSLAVLAGMTMPVTPLHILWINMVTTVTLALALAFEPTEPDTMRQPPRPQNEGLLDRFLGLRILWFGLALMLAVLAAFHWEMAASGNADLARTLAVNLLVGGEAAYLFNCRFLTAPAFRLRGRPGNRIAISLLLALACLQAAFTYLPQANELFSTQPLAPHHWAIVAGTVFVLAVLVEVEKSLWRQHSGPEREAFRT